MKPNFSNPGVHFLEESKRLPFHELPKDTPATLDAILERAKEVSEAPTVAAVTPAEAEAGKYGTTAFRDDSTTLAELKVHSLSRNPIIAFLERAAEKNPSFFRFISPKVLFWLMVTLGVVVLGIGMWLAFWYARA
jgi:hypothetical protein